MSINITRRNTYETSQVEERFLIPGLHSLNWAFADNLGHAGLPLRNITEISGPKSIGKSTVMFSLAGMVAAKYNRDALLIDFERQNETTVSTCLEVAGFHGNLAWETFLWEEETKKKVKTSSEKILDISTKRSYDVPPPVIMIDSMAAFKPTAIYDGDLGDANMGIKAKVSRQWFDRTLRPLISNPHAGSIFFTNHQMPVVGGFRPGPNAPIPTESSGGTAYGYLATQAFDLRKCFGYDFPEEGGWVVEGRITKNRDGYGKESKKSFFLYVQAGEGINKNLTAVIDCVMCEVAKSSSKGVGDSSTITLDGQNMGKFRSMIANRFDDEFFHPFHNKLLSEGGKCGETVNQIGYINES